MPRRITNLRKRNGVFWGQVKVAGHQYRASLRTTDRAEAKVRLEAWLKGLQRQRFGVPEEHTFAEALAEWAATVLPGAVKPAVEKRYLTSMRQFYPAFRELRMSEITTATISAYLKRRAATVSNATLQNDLTALSRLLAACVAWGWRQDNPARFYDRTLIRATREPIQPPTEAQLEAVLRLAPPSMAAVLRLLNATGMRENEAVTLERSDVDWSNERITLLRTKTNRPRAINWRSPGGDASAVLNDHRDRIGHLFVSRTGEPYGNFATFFCKVMKQAVEAERREGRKLKPFRVHDLRHGFAIRWLKAGGDIYRLQKHLGHSSVRTTEGYLAYLTVEEQELLENGGTLGGTVSANVSRNETLKRLK